MNVYLSYKALVALIDAVENKILMYKKGVGKVY